MTQGGTQFFFIEIATLETEDMAQKVLFWTLLRPVSEPPFKKKKSKILFLSWLWLAVLKLYSKKKFPPEQNKIWRW
jgi:hypothetical protein